MPALVAGSSVLVHLASDEGTAVTPLEACALGLAVAASRLPAFAEVLGDAACWIDDPAPQACARVLADAIASAEDPQAREGRKSLAAGFTWSRNARKTLGVWRHMLSPGAGPPHGAANGA